jgi:hypothetical protein
LVTELHVEVKIRLVRRVLIGTVALLTLASLLVQVSGYLLDGPTPNLLDSVQEGNVPTWLSSLGLLACAVLLAVIAGSESQVSRRSARPWAGLALLFLVAALDEAVGLHELVSGRIRRGTELDEFLVYTWVFPGTALVVALALYYRKFVADLPRLVRLPALWGVALFAVGALGLEIVEGRIAATQGIKTTFAEALMAVSEEAVEMAGIVLIIEALLRYVGHRGIVVRSYVTPLHVAAQPKSRRSSASPAGHGEQAGERVVVGGRPADGEGGARRHFVPDVE